ncbi:MAG: CehA/McbA family metallohydrolase, partial [Bythopirellula sp.]
SLQWWNARQLPVSADAGPVRMLTYAGATIPTTVFDYEIEHDWGAVYVVGQRVLLDRRDIPAEPNLSTLQRSHEQGALVCYQGGWSREVLLDALLGCVDVVNVCNNNFLRHAYQPRSRYSNLLQVPGFPTYANTAQEMWRMNTETYYRLLNCGLRLAAGAGSATGAKRTPVGYNRAYVRVNRDATWKEFLNNWRLGKNFVTNGPMLFLQVNEQARPGDTISLDQAGSRLHVEVEAWFPYPLADLELVMNGQVVHRVSQPESGAVIRLPITINESAWLIARCTAADRLLNDKEQSAYAWGSAKMPREPTRLRFAHTSPVYLSLQDKPIRVRESVREAHQMLDALERFAASHTTEKTQAEVAAALKAAREHLEN